MPLTGASQEGQLIVEIAQEEQFAIISAEAIVKE